MVNDCPVSIIKSDKAKRKCNLRCTTDRFIGMLGQNESSEYRSEGCGEPGAVQSLSTATGRVNSVCLLTHTLANTTNETLPSISLLSHCQLSTLTLRSSRRTLYGSLLSSNRIKLLQTHLHCPYFCLSKAWIYFQKEKYNLENSHHLKL